MNLNENIYKYIQDNKELLSKKTLEEQHKKSMEYLKENYKSKYIQDSIYNLEFLAISIRLDTPNIFFSYMKWLGSLMKNLNVKRNDMINYFDSINTVLLNNMTDYFEKKYKESIISILSTYFIDSIEYFTKEYDKKIDANDMNNCSVIKNYESDNNIFLEYLLNLKKDKAIDFVLTKLDKNKNPKDIYMNILQPTLYNVGLLWEKNIITPAKEHYITAVIQNIIALMYPHIFDLNIESKDKSMFGVCAGKELHELGIRMVCDFFEMDGWDTTYLGANLPIESVIEELKIYKPNLIAISTTLVINLGYTLDLIKRIKEEDELKEVLIFIGGKFLNECEGVVDSINVDGYGKDAIETLKIANKMVGDVKDGLQLSR
ncbi:MAG: cobalamin-dependent protein [Peptostreptococcaceae bacterium]|jgi:methanogenic corrinoid protein MtbC1|nr:cobalamin-dependent protein [Peptostreptococcaceae bacterium]